MYYSLRPSCSAVALWLSFSFLFFLFRAVSSVLFFLLTRSHQKLGCAFVRYVCVWCSVVLLQCYSIVYNIKRRLLGVRILPLLSRLFASQPRHFPHTSAAGTKRSLLCALSALPLKRKENPARTPGRSWR
jgi:hypothetical protein